MAEELSRIAKQMTDQQVKRKALEAGAKPIVDRARNTMRQYRRTGNLDDSIGSAYNSRDETQDVGWGGRLNTTKSATGFYGRFYENGYRPVTGNRKRVGGRWRWIGKRPSGKFIKRPHIRPAYTAERENVANRMIEAYKKELGGS